MSNKIAGLTLTLVLVLGIVPSVQGQRKPIRRVAPSQSVRSEGSISITFVSVTSGSTLSAGSAGRGVLDIGKVSSFTGARNAGVKVERHQHSMTVLTQFGVRLDNAAGGQGSGGFSAFLLNTDTRCIYSIDGIHLGISPKTVVSTVRYGAVTTHRLEIEVPDSVQESEGNIANAIGFMAVAN